MPKSPAKLSRIRRLAAASGAALASGLVLAGAAGATPLIPVSYDMPNGHGTASGGSFNYWDRDYTGTGAVPPTGAPHMNDGEALTGGLGDLTDGVIAAGNWFAVENGAGTGPYVGWRFLDPVIVFHFGAVVTVDSVTLYLDDANGAGAVSPPGSIDINGTNYLVADPVGGAPFSVTIGGLAAIGEALTIQLHAANQWVFLSEVTFDDGTARLPEPGALAVFGIGLAGLALARRRRRRADR